MRTYRFIFQKLTEQFHYRNEPRFFTRKAAKAKYWCQWYWLTIRMDFKAWGNVMPKSTHESNKINEFNPKCLHNNYIVVLRSYYSLSVRQMRLILNEVCVQTLASAKDFNKFIKLPPPTQNAFKWSRKHKRRQRPVHQGSKGEQKHWHFHGWPSTLVERHSA